jgi:ankyrin repeat protein
MNKCSLLLLLSAAVGCATVPKADRDLFAAIKENNASEVERLVASGANVNVHHDQSYGGLPPLAWAGVWGSTKAAELLIVRGAKVNGGDRYGSTPLQVAAYNQKPAMVALLVGKGADINARNDVGLTPLHKALEKLAMTPPNTAPPEGDVAKVVSVMELLLADGAAVDARSKIGTPIHLAALTGQKALVQMLIDKNADVNARSDDGQTPLYQAAKRDSGDIAELLLGRRADVNARTKSGYTALMVAAGNGNPGVASVLLEHGAEVGVRDQYGVPALLSACRSLLIRYTLEASTPGADDLRRKLPGADWAREREMLGRVKGEFSAVAVMLVNRGADPDLAAPGFTPLAAAATVGDRALAEALLAHGAKISDASQGETALHAAIAERHGDIAKLLIDKGADVNARNLSKLTPLHFLGVYLHDRELAELLIQRGADVNAREQAGHTPLEGAVRARNAEVAEVLRRHGGK